MITPQQIQEISFEKALFGGYDMASVDEFLEPLTEDYITLYKENSVLKSKMRILVEKLEEYRKQEASMQSAIVAAQKTCDQMLADTEKKCAKLLHEAEETASAKAQNIDALLGTEAERLDSAKAATTQFIDSMEKRLRRQIELLEELRVRELPPKEKPSEAPRAFDFEKSPMPPSPEEKADALIEEIGQSLEQSLNEADAAEKPAPKSEEKPAQPSERKSELHGDLPPAKQKILETLRFGRITDADLEGKS